MHKSIRRLSIGAAVPSRDPRCCKMQWCARASCRNSSVYRGEFCRASSRRRKKKSPIMSECHIITHSSSTFVPTALGAILCLGGSNLYVPLMRTCFSWALWLLYILLRTGNNIRKYTAVAGPLKTNFAQICGQWCSATPMLHMSQYPPPQKKTKHRVLCLILPLLIWILDITFRFYWRIEPWVVKDQSWWCGWIVMTLGAAFPRATTLHIK